MKNIFSLQYGGCPSIAANVKALPSVAVYKYKSLITAQMIDSITKVEIKHVTRHCGNAVLAAVITNQYGKAGAIIEKNLNHFT